MFSIFHGLFTLLALGVDNYNKTSQDAKNRERAIKNGKKHIMVQEAMNILLKMEDGYGKRKTQKVKMLSPI